MPRLRFANPYHAQTPVGESLNSIAAALFGGPTAYDMELKGAQTKAYGAHANLYDEQRRALIAKNASEKAANDAEAARVAGLPLQVMTGIFGDRPTAESALNFRRTGSMGYQGGVTADDEGNTLPSVAMPEAMARNYARANDIILANQIGDRASNAQQVSTAAGALGDQRFVEGAQGGTIGLPEVVRRSRAQRAVSAQPLVGGDRFVSRDLSDPSASVVLTPIGTAEQGHIGSQAKEKDAQAGLHGATARLRSAQAGQVERGENLPLVVATNPDTGVLRYMPRNVAGALMSEPGVVPKPGGAAGGKLPAVELTFTGNDENGVPQYEYVPKVAGQHVAKAPAKSTDSQSTVTEDVKPYSVKPSDQAEMNAYIAGEYRKTQLTGVKDTAGVNAIKARAMEYIITPGSPAYGNATKAAQLAVKDVAPKGIENNWISTDRVVGGPNSALPAVTMRTPTRTKTTTKTATKPGLPTVAGAPPAAASAPGSNVDQLIAEANDAVAKGADPVRVRARLKSLGVNVAE